MDREEKSKRYNEIWRKDNALAPGESLPEEDLIESVQLYYELRHGPGTPWTAPPASTSEDTEK